MQKIKDLRYNSTMDETTKEYIKDRVHGLPLKPGVYLMKDQYGNIIYIGKAKVLKNRVSQYFFDTVKLPKVQQMVNHVKTFDYIITTTELEALNLESNLIKKHQPFYNILLKAGSGHPFFKINMRQDFPTIEVTRKIKKDGSKYFGPYFGSVSAYDLLKVINNTFLLRNCKLNLNHGKKQKRECLNYHIGHCLAPCVGKVSKVEYIKEVDRVISFLNGNLQEAKEILTKKMKACVITENFERAIDYRESLKMIDNLSHKLLTELNQIINIDVFGYATNGVSSAISVLIVRAGKIMGLNNYNIVDANLEEAEAISNFITQYYPSTSIVPENVFVKDETTTSVLGEYLKEFNLKVKVTSPKKGIKKKLLDLAYQNAKEFLEKNIEKNKLEEQKTFGAINALKEKLGLKRVPYRIEGYDISNISGTNTVSSMVVFINGKPYNKHYRKFKIQTVIGSNDFASMKETLQRRLGELGGDDESFKNKPDLILIDGGKGQLGYANGVLLELGLDIDIVSLAKREEEVFKPNKEMPFILSRDDYALKLLQNVRDESHRFAITFNRKLRLKSGISSELKNIPLIGNEKIKNLIEHFRDINKIKNATIEELCEVKGISKKLAQNIVDYFHNKSN